MATKKSDCKALRIAYKMKLQNDKCKAKADKWHNTVDTDNHHKEQQGMDDDDNDGNDKLHDCNEDAEMSDVSQQL
jgi:hypothetical protein